MRSVVGSWIEPTTDQDSDASRGRVRGPEGVAGSVQHRPPGVPNHDLADPEHPPLEPVTQDRGAFVEAYEPGALGDPRHDERPEPGDHLDLVPVHAERHVRHQAEPEHPPRPGPPLTPLLPRL